MENRKQHWENIYDSKALSEVSWYQPVPLTSLGLIKDLAPSASASIIDIGGGDSFLVDHLLEFGYSNLCVLDISEKAIERARSRLGAKAKMVKWMVADAARFEPKEKYDLWHDRAAFHFLTDEQEIENYINTARAAIRKGGTMIIGTFSESGPTKCSGIEIQQYSEQSLNEKMLPYFKKIDCFRSDHETPFGTLQNFLFCSFRRV